MGERLEASAIRRRIWTARGLAVLADVIQIGLAPLFFEGGLSILDVALDVIMSVILTSLVGWHWAFFPAFVAELVPGLDLVPSWTLAVFLATRDRTAPDTALGHGGAIDIDPVRPESDPRKGS